MPLGLLPLQYDTDMLDMLAHLGQIRLFIVDILPAAPGTSTRTYQHRIVFATILRVTCIASYQVEFSLFITKVGLFFLTHVDDCMSFCRTLVNLA